MTDREDLRQEPWFNAQGEVVLPPAPVERGLLARRLAAGGLGVVGFLPTLFQHGDDVVSVWVPFVVLFAGALAIHRASLGAQLFARATWWANLLLGALLAGDNGRSAVPGGWLVLCCSLALLAVSTDGVAQARKRDGYAPAAFTTSLTLAMMLALADTLSLVLFTAIQLEDGDGDGFLLAAGAAAMIASFVGLYRIRPWGMAANLVTNIVVAAIAAGDGFGLPDEVNALFVITAAMQLLVAAPMIVGILRQEPLAAPLGPRLRKRVSQGGLAIVAAAAACWVFANGFMRAG